MTVLSLFKNASKQVEVKHILQISSSSILIILIYCFFTSSDLSVLYPQSSYLRNGNPLSSENQYDPHAINSFHLVPLLLSNPFESFYVDGIPCKHLFCERLNDYFA